MIRRIFILIACLISPLTHAQFVEEIGTLESLYEGRARAVLNTFLRPHEYSVVVSAEIERDEKKLDEYREKMELQFVPGLPIPADPSTMPATSDLHSMKSKVIVNLVLNTDIPPEKEALLKSILSSKLHLDEASGDMIVIGRAKFPEAQETPEPPQMLPEFSWKTWAMVFILAMLAFAGLIFWLTSRRRENGEPKNVRPDEKSPLDVDSSAAIPEVKSELSPDNKISEMQLHEAKDQLLLFVSEYPALSAKGIAAMMDVHMDDVVRTFEFLSWDLSRRLFSALPASSWGRLGAAVKGRTVQATPEEYLSSIKFIYKTLLARFLEAGARKDDANPFAFVFNVTENERRQLLQNETAVNLAVIGLFCAPEELKLLTEGASAALVDELPREMSRIQELPDMQLKALVARLSERLRRIQAAPSIFANGAGLAVRVLRSYSPEREVEVFARMKKDDPEAAARIRRLMVQFEDFTVYPSELVSAAVALVDIDQLAAALYGSSDELRNHIFNLMPSKRARMVQRDLETVGFSPSLSEVATQQRTLCLKIEEILAKRGTTIASVWEQIEPSATSSGLRAVS